MLCLVVVFYVFLLYNVQLSVKVRCMVEIVLASLRIDFVVLAKSVCCSFGFHQNTIANFRRTTFSKISTWNQANNLPVL